jgi:hypothetical protein
MRSSPDPEPAARWRRLAAGVAHKVNLGWWLETMAAPLLVTALVGSAMLLWLRNEFQPLAVWMPAAFLGTGLTILALVCWIRAATLFQTPEQALVRIEAAMAMNNALSAANAGVAPWPATPEKLDAGLRWQWPRLLVPPLGALALLAAGLLLPVGARDPAARSGPQEPQSWQLLDAELTHLENENVVEESYLEEARRKLEELRAQNEDQWFSHSSLEATDSLKEAHESEKSRVGEQLDRAAKALDGLEKNAAAGNPEDHKRLLEEFDQALEGLQNGAMKPNPELLEQMRQFGPENLRNLNPEQLQQLRDNLQKNADALKQAGGDGQGEGDDWSDELLAGDGEGDDQPGPGSGGIDRGPGHAPGVLGTEKDKLDTGELTGLEAKDLSRSTPGDLLELQNGEHDVDRNTSRLTEGGDTAATGRGGDRVWRDSLDPEEQRALKRFFE